MTDEWWLPGIEEEWQRAADAASALLVIEAMRVPQPGAVEIDRERCERVLAEAKERAAKGVPARPDDDLRGIVPS